MEQRHLLVVRANIVLSGLGAQVFSQACLSPLISELSRVDKRAVEVQDVVGFKL